MEVLRDAGHFVINLDRVVARGPESTQIDLTDYGQVIDSFFGINDRHDGLDAIVTMWVPAVALSHNKEYTLLVVAGIFSLVCTVSGWAVGSQRCRDFGWTGWAMLITLVPYVGWFFSIAIIFIPGTLGPNRYGSDPLER